MEVHTTQPGIQFYTGNNLDGSLKGKGAVVYPKHSAFCLETQNWPDAVNKVNLPPPLELLGSCGRELYHHNHPCLYMNLRTLSGPCYALTITDMLLSLPSPTFPTLYSTLVRSTTILRGLCSTLHRGMLTPTTERGKCV